MDILDYMLTYEPDNLKRQGPGRYVLRDHDSFVISNGKWKWNSRGYGRKTATALNYLIDVRGMGFVEAVETLTGERAISARTYQEQTKPAPEKRLFQPPHSIRCATNAVSYLYGRGIHSDVIGRCIRDGTLYESRYNGKAVCVFAGLDENKKVRFACMRGMSGDLKQDAFGSDKRYSFHFPAENSNSRYLAVFESPIDALSHATLQRRDGWEWDVHRLSLGGTSDVALMAYLERNPQITRVILHLDNDAAGITAARKIKAHLDSDKRFKHIRVSVNPPHRGAKDYNDALLHAIQSEQEQKHQSRRRAAISI